MMRETETVPDDEDDEARRSQTLLERPQRSHEESTNKYKYFAGLDGQYTLYQMRATCNQERIFPENIPVNKYLGKEDL